ncbi:MAG: DUF2829 domain-containing protein [Chroococcidiopsis sp.]
MSPYFDFGDAIAHLKRGGKVCREGWNGKGMWLVLIFPGDVTCFDAAGEYPVQPCIGMKNAKGQMQPGWLANQPDILAEDWMIVES